MYPEVWLAWQVCKVYLGSFNAGVPIRSDLNPAGQELFQKEQAALLNDLYEIPQRSCDRKVCFPGWMLEAGEAGCVVGALA